MDFRSSRKKSYVRLGDALKQIYERTPEALKEAAAVLEVWPDAVGDFVCKNTSAHSFRSQVLYVTVAGPLWKAELMGAREKLIKKINSLLSKPIVHDIVFYSGKVSSSYEPHDRKNDAGYRYGDVHKSQREKALAEVQVSNPVVISEEEVPDPRLRKKIQKLQTTWEKVETLYAQSPELFEFSFATSVEKSVFIPDQAVYDYYPDTGVRSEFIELFDGVRNY